jgi:UDP-N-acetylglucosamine 1-carboxyvinyltransferase
MQNSKENNLEANNSYLIVEGARPLNGFVDISGAKNSALKQLAAGLILPEGSFTLHNVPKLADIGYMLEIMRVLGAEVEFTGDRVRVETSNVCSSFVPYSLANKLRASFVCLGALVARFKEAKVSLPGGCDIGARKLDLHIKGLKALGCKIIEEKGYMIAKAERLIGNKIYLDIPSNGATENIMLAATMAEGETIIENAAKDPEIVDLANFLIKMGCKIVGAGSSTIHIFGAEKEELHSFEHKTIPDRIEAATYLCAGIMTGGKLTVKSVIEEDLQSLLSKFIDIGAEVQIHKTGKFLDGSPLVDISVYRTKKNLNATDITTVWYPGFSTDIQPIFSSLLSICDGTSIVNENIYDSRFQHAEELNRMGANIDINGKVAVIKGVPELIGTKVSGKDLRSTAALVVSALSAKGSSEIRGLNHLDRGYEDLEEKFTKLGAKIRRVSTLEEMLEQEATEKLNDSSRTYSS